MRSPALCGCEDVAGQTAAPGIRPRCGPSSQGTDGGGLDVGEGAQKGVQVVGGVGLGLGHQASEEGFGLRRPDRGPGRARMEVVLSAASEAVHQGGEVLPLQNLLGAEVGGRWANGAVDHR